MSQVLITVTGKFVGPTGAAAAGRISFTPTVNGAADPTLLDILAAAPVGAILDGSGAFSLNLIPTDDPARTPLSWTYRVMVSIVGAPVACYFVQVPIASPGGTVDLSTIAPVPPPGICA